MSIDRISTLQMSRQGQADILRLRRELNEAQGQVASGAKANDLKSFGSAASRMLTARAAESEANGRIQASLELEARFEVQGLALNQGSKAADALVVSIDQAIAARDGVGLAAALQAAFGSGIQALNAQWDGKPLFGGERQDADPVPLQSVADLAFWGGPQTLNESPRRQTAILETTPFDLAPKASEIGTNFLIGLQKLERQLRENGGQLGTLTEAQIGELQSVRNDLKAASKDFVTAEGNTGSLTKRMADIRTREEGRVLTLQGLIGRDREADLAEVAARMALLDTQYRATAQGFSQLSRLSLLDYLR